MNQCTEPVLGGWMNVHCSKQTQNYTMDSSGHCTLLYVFFFFPVSTSNDVPVIDLNLDDDDSS